ncbi:hypothetical protein [Pseudanabaena sp. FACHB-2040]|uniref:hypothetical protein n=1 Tax=Pseudanabaena sp. FACHB-2040 TaxID=2692859 RepID=UPI0016865130|nr:hypothetical protein [Pseudanabaena sp. FACHB-2040]MBD2259906.1 hypothetical protein [Pseudanabaena sp. FACHB-2040]
MYTRHNNLENLQTYLEVDSGYVVKDEGLAEHLKEVNESASLGKIVLSGGETEGALEDCYYLWVDPHYTGELSPGQRQLYEILLTLQQSSVYTLTTIGKLSEMMGLEWSLACGKRLENLQTVGAINGFK